jgi:hypothetical protein
MHEKIRFYENIKSTYAVFTVVYAPDDGWWCHPKHVEQFPDKLMCNVASCRIYIRIINVQFSYA